MVEAIKKGQVEANKNGLVDAINSNEELIAEYAKKIYGFAYSKTGNVNDADDLSQEILMSLLTIRFDEKQIENIGAYIYRVAQYTWAKYLRKSKPAFECLGSEDALALIEADGDLESDSIKRAEDKELYEKLRAAVMSLGRTRREAELNLFTGYAEEMKKLIPPCVCENERNHYLTSFDPHNAVLYTLMKEGLLRTPTESERKYICTVMWGF